MSYAFFLILGCLASWLVSRWMPVNQPLPRSQKLFISLIGFSFAVVAAKLPFWIFGESDLHNPGSLWLSGKTILAGLVGGYVGVEIAKWYLKIKTKTGDLYAVPVAVGIGIGRLGCFVGGCCYGTQTTMPWGIVFADAGTIARHPTQVYEVIFHLTMAGVMYQLLCQKQLRGQLIKLYFLSYFVFRFMTEFIRPEIPWVAGFTAYQLAIVVLIPVFIGLWRLDARILAPSQVP